MHAEEIRFQARLCVERATRTANERSRSTWLAMAQLWLEQAWREEKRAMEDALAETFRKARTERGG